MKKGWWLLLWLLFSFQSSLSQEEEEVNRSHIEFDAEQDANDADDDSYWQLLLQLRKKSP